MSIRYVLEKPFTLSCPECGGNTRREEDEGLMLYRCHIGHVFTSETLLHAQRQVLEQQLGAALAQLNERADLCRQLIETDREEERDHALLEAARAEALDRAETLRALLESQWTLPDPQPER